MEDLPDVILVGLRNLNINNGNSKNCSSVLFRTDGIVVVIWQKVYIPLLVSSH